MGKIVNFDFSSEKIKELVEETKKRCVQICEDCGCKFTEDTAKMTKKGLILICPECGSKKVKVELKK